MQDATCMQVSTCSSACEALTACTWLSLWLACLSFTVDSGSRLWDQTSESLSLVLQGPPGSTCRGCGAVAQLLPQRPRKETGDAGNYSSSSSNTTYTAPARLASLVQVQPMMTC